MRRLRIGTRGSLLALAQTRLIARELERVRPGLAVELVRIDTRGDRRHDLPLSQVTDPEFFCAELDEALAAGRVDLCVHSLKDLPARRPFARAIPTREDPRDIVLFHEDVCERLRNGLPLRLGTSTTRRAVNVVDFLRDALPQVGPPPRFEIRDIRGNVDQRLAQLRESDGKTRGYDAIVLALAGLERLWADETGRAAIAPRLAGLRRMVLPLSICPTAPGQGALALECRRTDRRTRSLIASLHDRRVASLVAQERRLLAELPERDRDAFGVTAVAHPALGRLAWIRGRIQRASDQDGEVVERVCWARPARPRRARAFDASLWRRSRPGAATPAADLSDAARALRRASAVFISHERALPEELSEAAAPRRLVAGGTATWIALARRGLWIEACAEPLGFEALRPTLARQVLELPPLDEWLALTHADALAEWDDPSGPRAIATYHVALPRPQRALRRRLAACTHFYWSSATQFASLRDALPPRAHHACGPGRTVQALRRLGVRRATPFPSVSEWRAWLG